MHVQDGTADQKLAAIAAGAHGVVPRAQALAAGVTREQIAQRVGRGALIRIHPGIYRVGHAAPSTDADYIAAVLACGDGAALSGRAAAYLLGLVLGKRPPPEVTCPTNRRLHGVTTHRCRGGLDPRDVTAWKGIPVTSPPRTLVDIAAHLSGYELARACHEAGVRHRTTPADVDDALSRWPNAPGSRALRRILHGDTPMSLSVLEEAFIAAVQNAELPLPKTNKPAGGRRVDCRWPDHHLTVELDSYRFHNSRHAWELDRKRERAAYARGDAFRRYTWADVVESPRQMMSELRALLG